jgi:hypothetical protein
MTPPDKQQIGDEAEFLDDEEARPKERTGSIGYELRASGPPHDGDLLLGEAVRGCRDPTPGAPVRCGGHRDRRDSRWSDRTLG